MPEKRTLQRARKDAAQGKSANTQAGEFVREEMHHIREGKHGARSTKQAIAIGLSKARRAGVKMPPPRNGNPETTKKAAQDEARAYGAPGKAGARRGSARKPSRTRSRATTRALKREGHAAATPRAIGRQAHAAAMRRTPEARSQSAKKAARTRKHERAAT